MNHGFSHRHRHRHAHMLERQKVICPLHEDCRINDNNHPCHHGVPHIKDDGCRCNGSEECPACIMTQEEVKEETFTEEEFKL